MTDEKDDNNTNNPPKKKKKKCQLNPKDSKKEMSDFKKETGDLVSNLCTEDDEIKKFEDLLKIESIHCSKATKARPCLSQEWISKLSS
jgi:hypothetical protein